MTVNIRATLKRSVAKLGGVDLKAPPSQRLGELAVKQRLEGGTKRINIEAYQYTYMSNAAPKSVALWVLARLKQAGFQALLAGGCVRDMLLHRRSNDYDIATDATPQQVRKLFPHVLLVGAKFGVAMVVHNRQKVEVTTFRTDLQYTDGRRPIGVKFSTPKEDALRRDFTINGMFYDPACRKVIDYVGGKADLRRGVIRTIGRPDERFAEDYLRMIRACRFAVRLGFRIAPATTRAIAKYAPNITGISGERIFDELSKMLSRDSAASALTLLEKLQLARTILPEMFAAPAYWQAAIKRVQAIQRQKDTHLALAALLAQLPVAAISAIMRRWGASNDFRYSVCWMAEHLDDWRTAEGLPLCDFKRLLANENFPRLQRLWRHEELSQSPSRRQAMRIAARIKKIAPDKIAPPPLVNGGDLKSIGLSQGPAMGKILRELYDAQLNEELVSRPAALDAARKLAAGLAR
jgi:poly(A) polymerase